VINLIVNFHAALPDIDVMFSTPLQLSSTLQELSMVAREPPAGTTADLIEHTIQASVQRCA